MNKQILRLSISGSVDDGKSTLLGRLLFDSKNLNADDISKIKQRSKLDNEIDYSLFTDGLKDEITQGITIDVAYRYFETKKKKIIVADTPGHEEYTRNMVTGSSLSDTSIILVDASKGIVTQTKRHLFLNSIMHVNHIIVCINKMDLINYDRKLYDQFVKEIEAFISGLQFKSVSFLPVSALKGDNIFTRSSEMEWYDGPTLNYIIENISLTAKFDRIKTSAIVQNIIRKNNQRIILARVLSGILRKNDEIVVLPSRMEAKIHKIYYNLKEVNECNFPMSVSFELDKELDHSRGNLITKKVHTLNLEKTIDVMFCWLDKAKLNSNLIFTMKRNSEEYKCKLIDIKYKYDINNLKKINKPKEILMNDIFKSTISVSNEIYYEKFKNNKDLGSFILIDNKHNTVAFAMIY